MDIHESLPSDAILHGLDVDISMAINHAWAPSRVTFETLDIFQPIPQHLLGQYDVVNVRLFAFVVKNNDPSAIVQKLASMLSPSTSRLIGCRSVLIHHRAWRLHPMV